MKTSRLLTDVTEGLFSTAVDFSLWMIAYWGTMSLPQSSFGQLYRAKREADRFLREVNYETIKQGIAEARRRRLLKPGKPGRRSWPLITAAGRRRLQSVLPIYDTKRVWDGRMYLVTYDIPESKHRQRDLLREYTRRIGCAKLQDSVYVTPYDPRELLREFISDHQIAGTIIVSDMGQDGSIGEDDFISLAARVYDLIDLNDRYTAWMKEVKQKKPSPYQVMQFLSILKDDPQLPFPLLPTWWKGDVAYAIVKPYLAFTKES